ncbi:MAG: sulfite exporter TauE/SafE family protein, partial [Halobacteria archaeon]|nr:sulfite exporter TauE/SafE family protein [Halobacteria archaeon]
WCNVHIRQAVATSAAIGLPIALAGAAGFMITGWGSEARPPWSVGYVNLAAFTGIVVASILFAPLGAKLAHTIPPTLLKRIFAVLLYVLGVRMLLAG